jgi:hypothetical protein
LNYSAADELAAADANIDYALKGEGKTVSGVLVE